MAQSLPARPNLEWLRKTAKQALAESRKDKPEGLLMTNTKVSSDGNKVIFKLSMAHEEVVKIVEKGMEITPSPTPLD